MCSGRNETLEDFATLTVTRIVPWMMKGAVEQSCLEMGKKLIGSSPVPFYPGIYTEGKKPRASHKKNQGIQ